MLLFLLAALVMALLPLATGARTPGRPGTLDPSFGRHGVFFSAPTPTFSKNRFTDLARQADGKILVAGSRERSGPGRPIGLVMRLLPDGSADPGFGDKGIVEVPPPTAIAVDSSGRILVATSGGECRGIRVRRLLADGSADAGFGGSCGTRVPFTVDDLAAGPDGAAFVGGLVELGTSPKGFPNPTSSVMRLGPDGGLDTSYGENGVARLVEPPNVPPYTDTANFAVLADGSVALATRGHVLRFTPEGKLDTSFGDGGKASVDGAAVAVTALPEGGLAVAGNVEPGGCCGGDGQFIVTRFLPNGTRDPAFGDDGVTKLALGVADELSMIATVPGEGLLVTGEVRDGDCEQVGCGYMPVAVRLGADGSLDPAFGSGGIVQMPLPLRESGTPFPSVTAAVAGPAGEVVVAATLRNGSSYLLEREGSGAPPAAFAGGGPLSWTTTLPSNMEPTSVGVLGDGRIVLSVRGNAMRHGTGQSLLTLHRDGRPVRTAQGGASGFAYSQALSKWLYASGKAAYYFDESTRAPRVMRVLPPDGSVATGKGAPLPKGFSGAGMTADGQGGVLAFGRVDSHPGLAVAHVRADGRLDRIFGRGGIAIVPFGKGRAGANALTVDAKGRIVAAGWASGRAVAARLRPDGHLDRGFGRGGRVDLLGPETNVTTVAAVGDEIVAGCLHETESGSSGSTLVRLDAHGRRVHGFGHDGVVVAGAKATPIAVLSSHGLPVLVTQPGGDGGGVSLRAYGVDGRPARGWGEAGRTLARAGQRKVFIPTGATATPDGQIVVAGIAGSWYVGNQTEVLRFR